MEVTREERRAGWGEPERHPPLLPVVRVGPDLLEESAAPGGVPT